VAHHCVLNKMIVKKRGKRFVGSLVMGSRGHGGNGLGSWVSFE
jgi:hypothetical protein